jgi:hypothetical protein
MSATTIFILVVGFLAASALLLLGRRRLSELVEGIEALTESLQKGREEDWRKLAEIWSGPGGGLRLLILVLGLIALIVTGALARRRGASAGKLLTLIGVSAAWLAFVIAILFKEAEVQNSTSSDGERKDSHWYHVYIIVIVFTFILIAGLLFFSQVTQ